MNRKPLPDVCLRLTQMATSSRSYRQLPTAKATRDTDGKQSWGDGSLERGLLFLTLVQDRKKCPYLCTFLKNNEKETHGEKSQKNERNKSLRE